MIAKTALFLLLVAVAFAQDYRPSSYGQGQSYGDRYDNTDYNYDVKDDQYYNYQIRDEYKDGKNVYGGYSVVEPDSKRGIAKYSAADYGYRGNVEYEGGYRPSTYKESSYRQPNYKSQSYSRSYQPSYPSQSYSRLAYQQKSYTPAYQSQQSYKATY